MEYTFRRGEITINEFIIAIAVGCPLGINYELYMIALLSVNPKNENELWMNFCKVLRRSEAPVLRSWRIWAHKLFVEQFKDIEREFLRRSRYISDPGNSMKLVGYLDKLIKNALMSRKEFDSSTSLLRQCGNFDDEDNGDNSDSDSDSHSGASGQTTVNHDDVPGTSGHVESKEDNGDAAQNDLSKEEIQPIDVTQLSPQRITDLLTMLYTTSGLALADDDLIDKMNSLTTKDNDDPKNSEVTGALEKSCSQSSASSVIQPTEDSSETSVTPTTLHTISRFRTSSDRSDCSIPSTIASDEEEEEEEGEEGEEEENEKEEGQEDEKTVKTSAQSQDENSTSKDSTALK